MKKKLIFATLIIAIMAVLLFPACDLKADGSIKSITRPYVGEYECVECRLGETDMLEKYEYIKITLLTGNELELSYKSKNGKQHSFEGAYEIDGETREITGQIGLLGYNFREKAIVKNGEFTITKNIMSKPLIAKFKMK